MPVVYCIVLNSKWLLFVKYVTGCWWWDTVHADYVTVLPALVVRSLFRFLLNTVGFLQTNSLLHLGGFETHQTILKVWGLGPLLFSLSDNTIPTTALPCHSCLALSQYLQCFVYYFIISSHQQCCTVLALTDPFC